MVVVVVVVAVVLTPAAPSGRSLGASFDPFVTAPMSNWVGVVC